MKNTKLFNRIIYLDERRTSMRLCTKEWEALKDICKKEKLSRNTLIQLIEKHKDDELGLSYSTRLFITCYYKEAATEAGHRIAGHGIPDNHTTLTNAIKKLFTS